NAGDLFETTYASTAQNGTYTINYYVTLLDSYSIQEVSSTQFHAGIDMAIWLFDQDDNEKYLFDSAQSIKVILYVGLNSAPVTGLTTSSAYDSTLQYFDNSRGLTEIGAGNYTFTISADTFLDGEHTLYINTDYAGMTISGEKTFFVEEHNITIELSSSLISSPTTSSDYVASDADSLVALISAGDTSSTSTAANTISISNNLFDNKIYTVFSRGKITKNIQEKMDYIYKNTLFDYSEPSFGYELREDNEVNIRVNTSIYNIVSDYNMMPGKYNLVIRNEGYDSITGKINISITPL
ncbi:MAG: hypothetical protein KAJ54_02585, partial [Candidatus Aenigmarchaeota archaeon]|nr:hypothetical protein [Candidatus Aenigmarchaeota archaeon]